jgi:hypothetical protein
MDFSQSCGWFGKDFQIYFSLASGTLICNLWGLFFVDTDGLTKKDINPYFWRGYFVFGTFFIILRTILL